ncbi:MAG: hypothetical protein ACR2KM_00895 [Gemmatimonadaceae bacterium]
MPANILSVIRWVLLASAAINLLQGTVLFHQAQRWIIRPWFEANARAGRPVPASMRDERVQRAWPLFMAVLSFGIWWYLGTPGGIAAAARAGSPH